MLAVAEFGLLLVLAGILNDKTGGLANISIGEAIWFYWLCWIVASIIKIVVLPIANLTYAESAGEFRHVGMVGAAAARAAADPRLERGGKGRPRPRDPRGLGRPRQAARAAAKPVRRPPTPAAARLRTCPA